MRRTISVIATTVALGCAGTLLAQMKRSNSVVIPTSSMDNPADAGLRAHTNIQVLGNYQMLRNLTPQAGGSPFPGFYEDPASLACIYLFQLQAQASGCNPSSALPNPSGGSRAIAIVDAFDNPGAYADLQVFSLVFGVQPITPSSFVVVFAPGFNTTAGSCTGPATRPPVDSTGGWELEESLDVDYAHAMAPGATLYLVEAQSNSNADLFCAVAVANRLVQAAGGGEVSMSWGGSEFAAETTLDAVFTAPGVVYFASSGDGPGVIYPSASPNVIAVGGTTLSRNPVTGNFVQENGWQQGGGGISAYETRPAYQSRISNIVGSHRGVPDVSADANPYTGAWVSNNFMQPVGVCPPLQTCFFFYAVGGTSLAAPLWAGMVNAANSFAPSTAAELTKLYQDSPDGDFNDIALGSCGTNMGYLATVGWDFCTGIGSPKFYTGK